jgi:hypothetical protein
MPSPTIVLAIVGAVVVTSLRAWAYRASPKTNPSPEATAVFRQRMVVYYGALILFVIAWVLQGTLFQPRQ